MTVLEADHLPDTLFLRGSARAHVAYALDARTGIVLAMCAIDNLARGASAQAVQALNVSQRLARRPRPARGGLFPVTAPPSDGAARHAVADESKLSREN